MKSQQTPINGRLKRRPHLPAAAEDAAIAAGEGLRHGADGALWAFQRRLLWPLQDRLRNLDGPARTLAGAAVLLVAVAVGVAGLLWVASGGSGSSPTTVSQVAETSTVHTTAPAPAPEKKQAAPTLHGAAPVFAPDKSSEGGTGGVSSQGAGKSSSDSEASAEEEAASAESAATASAGTSAATGKISSSPAAATSTARASTPSGPPAGPAALAAAREFSDAFVIYEIGGTDAKVRAAFHASASRQLAHSLLRRPPKQPATVKVPQAKVVNVVAAPSQGSVYPVSVSLLRVGVTSELRLELEQVKKGDWQVVNVLG